MFLLTLISRFFLFIILLGTISACDNASNKKVQYLEEAKQFYKYGEIKKAQAAFDKALAVDPKNKQAQLQMIEEIVNLGDVQTGVKQYLKIIKQDAREVTARVKLAQLLFQAGKIPEAEQMAQEALVLDADNIEANILMGGILSAQHNTDAAFLKAEQALRQKPDNVPATLLLASLNAKIGKTLEAIALLQHSIEKNPKYVTPRLLLVNLYVQNNDREKARELLSEIITLEPKAIVHRQRLAMYYIADKQTAKAEEILRIAANDLPNDEQAKLLLIEFLATHKSNEAAIAELLPMLEENAANFDLRFKLAELQQAQQKYEEVEAILKESIALAKQKSESVRASNKLAQFYIARNRIEDAKQVLGSVLGLQADNTDALVLKAELALADNKVGEAITGLRAILNDEPYNFKALKDLSHAHQLNNEPLLALENLQKVLELTPNDEDARLEAVDLLLKSGNTKEAGQQLNTLFKLNPNSKIGLEALTKIYLAQKQWEQARQTAKQIQTQFSTEASGFYLEGLSYQAEETFEKSIEPLALALQKQPEAVEALNQLITGYLVLKQPDKAIVKLNEIIKNHPNHFYAFNLLGSVYGNLNKFDEAIAAYQKAIQIRPDWSKSYRNIAIIKRLQKKPQEAIDMLTKGIANCPESADIVNDLVKIHHQAGNHDRVISLYEEYLKKKPESLSTINNLVSYITDNGKDKASIDKSEKLLELLTQSNNPYFLDTAAWFMYHQGQYEKAKEALLKAKVLNSANPINDYHLGMIYLKLGDKTQAKQYLQQAVESKLEFNGRQEAITVLKDMKTV